MKLAGGGGKRSTAYTRPFEVGAWLAAGVAAALFCVPVASLGTQPFLQAIILTLRLALTTTLLLLVGGLPLARWLNTSRWRGAGIVQTLIALPMVLPPTVIGFYLLVCFAPDHFPGSVWLRLTGRALSFSFTGLVHRFDSLQPARMRCSRSRRR